MSDSVPEPGQKIENSMRMSRAERARTRWVSQKQKDDSNAGARSVQPDPVSSPTVTVKPRLSIGMILLYPLVLLSLGLNAFLIWQLLQARDMAYDSLDQVLLMTDGIEDEVFAIPIQIDQEFPVNVSVPFEYSDTFPVNMVVPISDTLSVPFEIMDSTIMLEVPVDMTVPINVVVPVSLKKTFDISTTIPVKFDMNVEFSLADTPIPGYLSSLRLAVQEIKQ